MDFSFVPEYCATFWIKKIGSVCGGGRGGEGLHVGKWTGQKKLNSECNNTFLIDLAPNGLTFGSKPI